MDNRTSAGSLGPRLAGRLTAELILRSPQYMNCIKYYEIDLRGNKIGAIENLGATENQFDSLDLSDNNIVKVEGFPRLPRLKMLLLNNNRVARIASGLQEQLPNLESLILTNNKIATLQDIDHLVHFKRLKYVSFMGCPIAQQADYRLYAISRLKRLKVLDFRRVRQKERDEALKKYGANPVAAAATAPAEEEQPSAKRARTFEPDEELAEAAPAASGAAGQEGAAGSTSGQGLPPEQMLALKAAIANAQTLEEVQRLEEALRSGTVPSEVSQPNANGVATAQPMEEG